MDTKALRQKILDLAIRGKLVPQDPNDEPASVLLERIRAQKQQMVKEGKLKAKDIKNDTVIFVGENNLHYEKFQDGSVKCIEDEIPFEIPQGWEWCRLGSITQFIRNGANIKQHKEAQGYPITRIETISNGEINTEKFGYANIFELENFEKYLLHVDDILMSHINSPVHLGKCAIYDGNYKTPIIHGMNLLCIRLVEKISSYYLLYIFRTSLFKYFVWKNMKLAVNQASITTTSISSFLIPIAPLKEQNKISIIVTQYTNLIDEIEKDNNSLQQAVSSVKSRILDLAIRGKLVPQDPNDEPASVLLERIRAEKEELINQGKIKRDKKESVIFKGEDNSYYQDLPKNWTLTTLADITTPLTLNDGDWILSENMDNNGNVKLIQLGAIGKMQYIDKGFKFISDKTFNDLKCSQVYSGFLLINRIISDAMNVCILPTIEGKIITTVDTCWIAPNENNYNLKYLMFMLSSSIVQSKIKFMSSGTTRKRISKNNLIKIPFPFPPLAEQHRIVCAIETYFSTLDKISNSLS